MTDTAPAAESTSATPDAAPAATPNVAPETPPWGADFNAERAWTLVQNLRADKDKLSGKVGEFEKAAQDAADAKKSDLERAIARAEKAEKAIADREAADQRKTVLAKHGLSDDDAAFLAGVSDSDLDARAQALAARLGIGQSKQDAAEAIPGKPTPKLTAGHESSDAGDAFDPLALAEKVHKRLI